MMPGMDGYDTMRAIRALDEFRTVPIIAVTGKVVPGERKRCLDAGANDYVPKPVNTADLIAAIGPWLAASDAARAAQPDAGERNVTVFRPRLEVVAPPTESVASSTTVPILIVDDNAAKRLALKAVLRPLGHVIVEAESGLEALRCVMTHDFAVILLDVRMPIMDGFETAALDPHPPAIGADADHLHHRVRQRRDRDERPVRAGSGRLHLRPRPAGGTAGEGGGVREPLHQGRDRSRRWPTTSARRPTSCGS